MDVLKISIIEFMAFTTAGAKISITQLIIGFKTLFHKVNIQSATELPKSTIFSQSGFKCSSHNLEKVEVNLSQIGEKTLL